MPFSLPPLPYAQDALAPHMSSETIEYHYGKHHQTYVENLNRILPESGFTESPLAEIVQRSYGTFMSLFNNAGQHYNHTHFWRWMKKGGGGKSLPPSIQEGIERDLGGYDQFRTNFIQSGLGQFGSGWCWLAVQEGRFLIMSTPNGENPLVHGCFPILGCDVWEHAYYIDYRNGRQKYLEAFLDHLVDWEYAEEMLRTKGDPD